jgi:hypothetical protein
MAVLSKRSLTQVAKGKEIIGVTLSLRDHLMNCFADIARGKIIILRIVRNCRTRRRGMTHQSQRVKLMVVPLLPLIMVMFLLLLLDVHLMIPFGNLILHVHIMSALIELSLVLMYWCRMEVLFGWAIILLMKLLAWAPYRSRCLRYQQLDLYGAHANNFIRRIIAHPNSTSIDGYKRVQV